MKFELYKASVSKRLAAFLIDFLIFCLIVLALAPILSYVLGYESKVEQYNARYNSYGETYGISLDLTQEEIDALSERDKVKYDEASLALGSDQTLRKLQVEIILLFIAIASLAILFSFIIFELVLPLVFKNGQTLGKKIFNIGVMRVDGVKITPLQVFVRAILGKFTVETMFPIFLALFIFLGVLGAMGLVLIAAILILQLCLMIFTKTNSMIHDLFAVTVTVDLQKQAMFNDLNELIEYKKKIAEQKAREQVY